MTMTIRLKLICSLNERGDLEMTIHAEEDRVKQCPIRCVIAESTTGAALEFAVCFVGSTTEPMTVVPAETLQNVKPSAGLYFRVGIVDHIYSYRGRW